MALGKEALPAFTDLYRTIGRIIDKPGFQKFIGDMAEAFGYLAQTLSWAAEKLEDVVELYERLYGITGTGPTIGEKYGLDWGSKYFGLPDPRAGGAPGLLPGGLGSSKAASNIITNNTNIVVTTPSVDGGIIGQGIYREQRYIQRGFQ